MQRGNCHEDPNLNESLNQVTLTMRLHRPTISQEKVELVGKSSSSTFVSEQPAEVQKAVGRFVNEIEAFSKEVERRTFD